MADNAITDEGGANMARLGSLCIRLDVAYNNLGCAGVNNLARHLDAPNLLHLSLRDNEILVDGAFALARAIHKGAVPNMKSLNLRQNQILVEGVTAVCEALMGHSSIEAVDFRENSIHQGGMDAVAELVKAKSLKALAICRNDIGDAGAKVIADACMAVDSIEMLLISMCKIGEKGGQPLLTLVKKKPKIVAVAVKDNLMGGMKRQLIEDKVLENKNGGPKKLSHLDMMMQSWVAAEMMNAESSDGD